MTDICPGCGSRWCLCEEPEEKPATEVIQGVSKAERILQTTEVKTMKDQHKKIEGYRDLSQSEIDLMNEGKELAKQCGEFITKLEGAKDTDKRNIALGKTNLQQGFMWAIRSVARPTTF